MKSCEAGRRSPFTSMSSLSSWSLRPPGSQNNNNKRMVPAHMTLGLMAISQFAKRLNYPFNSRISILLLTALKKTKTKRVAEQRGKNLHLRHIRRKRMKVWLSQTASSVLARALGITPGLFVSPPQRAAPARTWQTWATA